MLLCVCSIYVCVLSDTCYVGVVCLVMFDCFVVLPFYIWFLFQ